MMAFVGVVEEVVHPYGGGQVAVTFAGWVGCAEAGAATAKMPIATAVSPPTTHAGVLPRDAAIVFTRIVFEAVASTRSSDL